MKPFDLHQEAGRCVRCGYCLTQCPTYNLLQNEGDSPRGRISLISAFASGQMSEADINPHINQCLLCSACEGICPSGVPYYELISETKQQLYNQQPLLLRWKKAILLHALANLGQLKQWSYPLIAYSNHPIRRLIQPILGKKLQRLNHFLPSLPAYKPLVSSQQTGKRIGLFTGCISRLVDQDLYIQLQAFLESQGYQVILPPKQACCGALHYHSGQKEKGLHQLRHNEDLFSQASVDTILSTVSGCGAFIHKHISQTLRVQDINDFLLHHIDWSTVTLSALDQPVLIHTPCSLKQDYGQQTAALRMMTLIPNISVTHLDDNGMCCGAAGNYMIEHPDIADALVEDKIAALKTTEARILLTSNIGCSMHLIAAIKRHGLSVKVMHPAELLLQQVTRL